MATRLDLNAGYMLGPELGAIIVENYVGSVDDHGCYTGEGEATFKSGNTYKGGFCRGVMDGRGRYTWVADGTIYDGDIRKNELTGEGRYTWGDGSSYKGAVLRGIRHGQGTLKSSDGKLVYEGGWIASKRDGYGVQKYGVGTNEEASYSGQWEGNHRHGKGVMTYASGSTYDGDWIQDRKHGRGTMMWSTRRERYVGDWADDLPSGFGEHIWLDDRPDCAVAMDNQKQMCNVYRGQWRARLRHGYGTFLYGDGSRHTGQWRDNKKHGPAVFVSANGRTFEGRWENDAMIGLMSHDDGHPELSAAIKLKVTDLVDGRDNQERATAVREVERSILQLNSDLKALYKYYARPGLTAPRDRAMFTLSTTQFVAFARDCHALQPWTPVTVGEVYRILSRMRRQHSRELAGGLRRALQGYSNNGDDIEEASWEVVEDDDEDLDKVYDSRGSVLYREFVEGVLRLAYAIESQIPGGVARPPPTAASSTSSSGALPAVGPGRASPRSLSPIARSTRTSATDSQVPDAPAEGAAATPCRKNPDCELNLGRRQASDEDRTTPNLNECFKRFAASHLAGLSAKLAAESSGGGVTEGVDRGRAGGKAIGRGEKRGARTTAETNKGIDDLAPLPSACAGLESFQEQITSLYRRYSGPPGFPMTLRGFLTMNRDAGMRERLGLTREDSKKVFYEAIQTVQRRDHLAFEQNKIPLRALAPPSSVSGAPLRPVAVEEPAAAAMACRDSAEQSPGGTDAKEGGKPPGVRNGAWPVDLDALEDEIMREDFKVALAAMFDLLRAKKRKISESVETEAETDDAASVTQAEDVPTGDDPKRNPKGLLQVQEEEGLREQETSEQVDCASPSKEFTSSPGANTNKETGNDTAQHASRLTEKEILSTGNEATGDSGPGGVMAPVQQGCLDDPTKFISMILEWIGHVADAPCGRTPEGRSGPIMHRKALIRALLEPAGTKQE